MHEALAKLIEDSFQIAWDYLEATGELGAPDVAANTLLDTIEALVKHGERRRLGRSWKKKGQHDPPHTR